MQVLRYFPIIPRLKHLYGREHLARLQMWHSENVSTDNVMRFQHDSPSWKAIDTTWPAFGGEPRNVRLGLAIDGVNPHKLARKSNSIWPVLLINYNIPPWLAIRKGYVMLTCIIPGPDAPKNPDVWLAPLLEEFVTLWEDGVNTKDVSRPVPDGRHFQMRAICMHSISDGQGKCSQIFHKLQCKD